MSTALLRRPAALLALAALVAAAALLLAPALAPQPAPLGGEARAQASSIGTTEEYVEDVERLTDALFAFGTSFQSVRTASDLPPAIDDARERLDAFRDAAATLGAYRLERPRLERQRAALVRSATPFADAATDMLDALGERDLRAVREARARAKAALADITRASRGRPPAPRPAD
jgi:hypothetical protein